MHALSRRTLIAAIATAPFAARAQGTAGTAIEVEKTASCGCCKAWIEHLQESGFAVKARDVSQGELTNSKAAAGLKPEYASCHTARVEGYVVEGHVPAEDIRRLLAERPDAIGLSVPGMPLGSPGMDFGDGRDAYDVLLVKRDGSADVYSSYKAVP